MPYTKDQLTLFKIALSMLEGDTPYSYSEQAAKIARSTTKEKLRAMIAEGVKKE
jgi:hypothetical protein